MVGGGHYTFPLSNDYDEDDLEELSRYLRDEFGAIRGGIEVDSDEAGYTVADSDSIDYEARDVGVRVDQLPEEACLNTSNGPIASRSSKPSKSTIVMFMETTSNAR